jgi:hypothetical protein
MTSINTTDIAAPIESNVPVEGELPASDPTTEIAAPGEIDTAPSLGNLPSDSSLDIAAPQTLEASVPPIESAPSPLEVAPPEGFALDDAGVGVFGIDCGINDASCTRPKPNKPVIPQTVGEKDEADEPENNPNVDGGDKDREPTPTEQEEIDKLTSDIKGKVDSSNTDDFITLTLDFAKVANGGVLDPAQTIAVLTQIRQQVSDGMINSVLVDDVVATLQAGKVQELAATGQDLRAGITLAPDPNQAAMAGVYLLRYRAFAALGIFLGTGGNPEGERQFFTALYLTVITGTIGLMANKDDSKTNPQVVGLALADVAGFPPGGNCFEPNPSGSNLPNYKSNDAHNPNLRGYDINKAVEPADAQSMFQNSLTSARNPGWRVTLKPDGTVYRYFNDGLDTWHFSGASNGVNRDGKPIRLDYDTIPKDLRDWMRDCGFGAKKYK